ECGQTSCYRAGGQLRSLGARLRIHYIPGNHDRLVNVFPSLRARVRQLLNLAGEPRSPFAHVLEWPAYGVRVRHGHEYDKANFPIAFDGLHEPTEEHYAAPVLGDFVTVELATRLALAFRGYYARELRQAGPEGDAFRRIYLALTEFDDVRPASAFPTYVAKEVGRGSDWVFARLRPAIEDTLVAATQSEFFLREATRLGFAQFFEGAAGFQLRLAIANASPHQLSQLIANMSRFQDAPGPAPADIAALESGLLEGQPLCVIAGHTHKPGQVAIPGRPEHAACFVDSGTWRTRMEQGVAETFGRFRSYTIVFCYRAEEWASSRVRTFETWTGHLVGEAFGSYSGRDVSDRFGASTPSQRRLQFTHVDVVGIDEGETAQGAELELDFGVDDRALELRRNRVYDGERIQLDEAFSVWADPALDGEVWGWGKERDLGNTIVDRDDPLSFAVAYLERRSDGSFADLKAPGELHLVRLPKNHLVLGYRWVD
ncbi:MAG TPA: hypothetical protein VFQ61_07800, partial [Polyangiaceae bacterium]|nr:hypothetical protein [Polyangiaceae bacterium]